MRQTFQRGVGWAFAVLGIGLFASQAGEILIQHETWAQVFTPHGVGDLLKAAGSAVLAVLGYIGVRIANGKKSDSQKGD